MALTNGDIKKVKGVIKSEVKTGLDDKLGPKLEKVERLITKNLDQRLGPKLENFQALVKDTIDQDETLVRKDDIKNLPTKGEFFTKMDELMTEVKASREEQSLLSNRVSVHSDQIERIEKHIGLPTFDI